MLPPRPFASTESPIGSLPWLLLAPFAAAAPQAPPAASPFALVQQPLPWALHDPVLVPVDLDGDGADELLVTGGDGFLGLVRFDASGQLHAERIPVPGRVQEVSAADLDGDGHSDAAVATWAGLFVLWNDAEGRLVQEQTVANGWHKAVRSGDLDGDGSVDLVALSQPTGLRSWLGDGAGSFLPGPVERFLGAAPIALGDWDEDGDLDAVATHLAGLRLILNDGSGGLVKGRSVDSPWPVGLVTGDVNGDGHLDLAGFDDRRVFPVLLGDGQGGFSAGPESSGGWMSFAGTLAAGDFDGDGTCDLLTSDDAAFVMRGSAALTLLRGEGLPLGQARAVAFADVDGDGRLDAVAWRQADMGDPTSDPAPGWITVGYGDGHGGLRGVRRATAEVTSFPFTPDATTGDLDGDGAPDLVESGQFGKTLRTQLADGSGGWRPAVTSTLAQALESIQLHEIDDDDRLDLVALESGTSRLIVLPGDGGGGFSDPIASDLQLTYPALPGAAGDFDEDGDLDLLSLDWQPPGPTKPASSLVSVHPGDGRGRFGPPLSRLEIGTLGSLATGDLDLDGHLDLVASHWGPAKSRFQAWRGDGRGAFQDELELPALGGPVASLIEIEDLDADGLPDLLVGFVAPGQPGIEVAVLRARAPGVFGPPSLVHVGGWVVRSVARDVDGDGRLDLVLDDAGGWTLRVLRGDGAGTFEPWLHLAGWGSLMDVADMDRDGDADLVLSGVTLLNAGR